MIWVVLLDKSKSSANIFQINEYVVPSNKSVIKILCPYMLDISYIFREKNNSVQSLKWLKLLPNIGLQCTLPKLINTMWTSRIK